MLTALIVEDNGALRSAVARHFERRGWQVVGAEDGLRGLDAIRRRLFDVVISDVNMPKHGGLWLWKNAVALRSELRGRFVLISSEPLPEPRGMGFFVNSERFLLKPLSLATLWGEVQTIVAKTERTSPQAAWDVDSSADAFTDQLLGLLDPSQRDLGHTP